MKRVQPIMLLAALFVAGCSSSDYHQQAPVAAAPPPAASQTDFSSFVTTQFAQTNSSETAVPVAVESTNFAFADDNNPAVFSSLLATL